MSNQSPFFPLSGFPGRDQASSFFAGPIGLALALYAVSYGVPAIHDLVSGPQPKTVFPACSIARRQPSTSHMTTFETPYEHDIQTQGGLGEALYNACMFRDSEQTMILYYYPRTWILADVQLAD